VILTHIHLARAWRIRIDWRADASYGGWDFHARTLRSTCRHEAAPPPNVIFAEVPNSMALFADQVRALGYSDADVTEAAWAARRDEL
jgi:hypothetical protein